MVDKIKSLIKQYSKWLSEQITVKEVGEYQEITTPFLDRHNDCIQLYLKELPEEGLYLLTDAGYTIDDLIDSGAALDTDRRRIIFNDTLRGFGVNLDNNELTIKTTATSFPQKKHNLIQAILSVNDMAQLSRSNTNRIFLEDLKAWMKMKKVRCNYDVNITGGSGLQHQFPIIIPPSIDEREPERIIQIYNKLSLQQTQALAFKWQDIREVRTAKMFVITGSDSKPSKNVKDICDTCGITVSSFSNIESIAPQITA